MTADRLPPEGIVAIEEERARAGYTGWLRETTASAESTMRRPR